jgi:predicted cupin superfamily sugar epimerase
MTAALPPRAAQLVRLLGLRPHPEGGHYAELYRSTHQVRPDDGRPPRAALTSIDFLLVAGAFSAWHRVASDEAWHLLEGGPLRLWLAAPTLDAFSVIDLAAASAQGAPRHVVPAGWWQAAEPLADFAYVGATVGPGFDFADFDFGRDDAALQEALAGQAPDLQRLL